jgi:hypothetical protein
MTQSAIENVRRPRVLVVGEFEQPDFRDAVARLRDDTKLCCNVDVCTTPELIVIAQNRPGTIDSRCEVQLRRRFPLASIVSLLGSWCEGEARQSRPNHSTLRLYWYEFPFWWQRQLALYTAGHCPDWARVERVGFQTPPIGASKTATAKTGAYGGLVEVCTIRWETADALADILHNAGYAMAWQPPGRICAVVRGTVAGIWEGGQLDEREAVDLAAFCRRLGDDSAPVIALLDFPRRDRCEVARSAGAAVVLAKPWINVNLVAAVERAVERASIA